MSYIYDRLYGRIEFPDLINELLSCPGMLRLSEIGMGNIKFISFPSFSAVTRYEHSLGVCHLANLASKSLRLSEKDRIELMMAALYHDVTTPPFAHATEEILRIYYGFDHEKHFFNLISGKSNDLGGSYTQIYRGRSLKLPRICQSAEARRLGIDLFHIPELIFKKENDPLSSLISGDIDLDNIDNVIRSASAMGIDITDKSLGEFLAKSFTIYTKDDIALPKEAEAHINKWKKIREILYDMILCSIEDFSLQTMLKHALRYLIESDDIDIRFREDDWKLTEEDMAKRIMEHPSSRDIYTRMQLRDLYPCIELVWIQGKGALEYIENKKTQRKLEDISREILHIETVSNYYIDKRQRNIQRSLVSFDRIAQIQKKFPNEPALLLGFFTPQRFNLVDKESRKKILDTKMKNDFVIQLSNEIPKNLSIYKVNIDDQNKYPKMRLGEIAK
ncbi:MAG: HD domain-containing protein [Methanothrix sp.]|nr:HD domain-containing protein [Methanothrix sp.]